MTVMRYFKDGSLMWGHADRTVLGCSDPTDYFAREAWERMTYGGIRNTDGPGVYYIVGCVCRQYEEPSVAR